MELSHDGKCYKLITVSSDISSICEADFKDSGTLYAGYIIDFRTVKAEDIIIKLANFLSVDSEPQSFVRLVKLYFFKVSRDKGAADKAFEGQWRGVFTYQKFNDHETFIT